MDAMIVDGESSSSVDQGWGARCRTTRWSVVFAAGTEGEPARAALAELYRAYWNPVLAFIARDCGRGAAAELAQDFFFGRIIAAADLKGIQRLPGQRFRGWLFTAVKSYLSNQRRFHRRQRRDVRRTTSLPPESDSFTFNEGGSSLAAAFADPERLLQRARVLALLTEVLQRLRREYCARAVSSGVDAEKRFERLKVFLPGPQTEPADYAACAEELGTTTDAVKQSVHRLRRRFGALLHELIRQSVRNDDEVAEAKRFLCEALEAPQGA
jgi:DNA-directed RNA polymerase specialized sigma24 family protein